MKCDNCGTWVESSFAFAIKNNQCPACGKEIMGREQMVAYLSLVELFTNSKVSGSSDLASLVVANFDIKQKFREPAPIAHIKSEIVSSGQTAVLSQKIVPSQDNVEISDELVKEPDIKQSADEADKAFDEEFKKNQMKDAKEKLKQMRDQLYEEALKDQWGLGGEEQGLLIPDGNSMIDTVQQMKRDQSHQNVLSGGRGSFRRG